MDEDYGGQSLRHHWQLGHWEGFLFLDKKVGIVEGCPILHVWSVVAIVDIVVIWSQIYVEFNPSPPYLVSLEPFNKFILNLWTSAVIIVSFGLIFKDMSKSESISSLAASNLGCHSGQLTVRRCGCFNKNTSYLIHHLLNFIRRVMPYKWSFLLPTFVSSLLWWWIPCICFCALTF